MVGAVGIEPTTSPVGRDRSPPSQHIHTISAPRIVSVSAVIGMTREETSSAL